MCGPKLGCLMCGSDKSGIGCLMCGSDRSDIGCVMCGTEKVFWRGQEFLEASNLFKAV